ncbi:hypothetical protein T4D_12817 [Trichinella pseudospiralis]|uniref:Uncharacterized protein n=1 Tax=Trichinella pseudospiralis TaxID=6337 RepID=A0A0V1G036_TRIPS|nr:hypothetical protein T4D_12817 [Trichinella pseudospiralis]
MYNFASRCNDLQNRNMQWQLVNISALQVETSFVGCGIYDGKSFCKMIHLMSCLVRTAIKSDKAILTDDWCLVSRRHRVNHAFYYPSLFSTTVSAGRLLQAPREKSAALFHLNQAATLVNTLRRNKHADPEEANFSTVVRTFRRQFPFAKSLLPFVGSRRLVKTSTVPLLELFLAKR